MSFAAFGVCLGTKGAEPNVQGYIVVLLAASSSLCWNQTVVNMTVRASLILTLSIPDTESDTRNNLALRPMTRRRGSAVGLVLEPSSGGRGPFSGLCVCLWGPWPFFLAASPGSEGCGMTECPMSTTDVH